MHIVNRLRQLEAVFLRQRLGAGHQADAVGHAVVDQEIDGGYTENSAPFSPSPLRPLPW